MKFYLTSAYPISRQNFGPGWLTQSAEIGDSGVHQITHDPDEADLILFVENHPAHDPYFFQVLGSPLFRKYRRKCMLFHDADYVVPIVPGVYPSIEKRMYDTSRTRSFHYIARLHVNDCL